MPSFLGFHCLKQTLSLVFLTGTLRALSGHAWHSSAQRGGTGDPLVGSNRLLCAIELPLVGLPHVYGKSKPQEKLV